MRLKHIFSFIIAFAFLAGCSAPKYSYNNKPEPTRGKVKSNNPDAWDIDGYDDKDVAVEEEETEPYFGIKFQKSDLLRPLLEQARREGKLVFVDFYATWCGPCKAMERNVFSDKRIGDYFNDNFISYKVDADGQGSHIAAIYDIKSLPTLLFLDGNGEILARHNSAIGISQLKSLAQQAQQLHNASAVGSR